MVTDRLNTDIRSLMHAPSRRDVLRGLAGAGLGLGIARLPDFTEARKKRKRKKKCKRCGPCAKCKNGKCKPKPAGTSCGAGKQCFGNGQCLACDVCGSGCPASSIQAAIDAASAGDTIHICAGTFGGVIRIAKTLTLRGAGDDTDGTILDGQGSGPVVEIDEGITVHLAGLRITGGSASDGGGIDNGRGSTLILTDSSVTGNEAEFAGGGIYNRGALILTDSSVTDNSTTDIGGGIYNLPRATLTLTDSSVTNNRSIRGGGIYNQGTLTRNGATTIADNDPDDCRNVGSGTGCP